MTKLEYVFKFSVLSCADNGSWVERSLFTHTNETKQTPYAIAAHFAAEHLTVTETGVKVEYLGLREARKGSYPITPMGPFTVIIHRNSAKIT